MKFGPLFTRFVLLFSDLVKDRANFNLDTRFLQFHESSLHFKLPVRINLYSNFNNTKKFFYSQVALFSKKFFYEEEEEDHACVKEIRLYFHSIIESNHRFTTDLSSPLVQ